MCPGFFGSCGHCILSAPHLAAVLHVPDVQFQGTPAQSTSPVKPACLGHLYHQRLGCTAQVVAPERDTVIFVCYCGRPLEPVASRSIELQLLFATQVLGCTAPMVAPETDAIIFVADGRFHLEAIMIANPAVPAFR